MISENRISNMLFNVYQVAPENESRFFILMKNLRTLFLCKISDKFNSEEKYIFPVQAQSLALSDERLINRPDVLHHATNSNAYILFDHSSEAINYDGHYGKQLLEFHHNILKYNLPTDRIILLCANSIAKKGYNKWYQENNISKPIKMVGYDFLLFEYYHEITVSNYFRKNASDILNKTKKNTFENILRPYHYMSLNLRPRKQRALLLTYLLSKNYLKQGIVTYFGDEFGHKDTITVDTTHDIVEFIKLFDSKLLQYYLVLQSLSPITFERNSAEMRKDLWIRQTGEVEFLIPEVKLNNNFNDFKSYFEIVTETWLADECTNYITEKTIRPILRLQPFIHIGPPNHLRHLRELGFKTFSPFINEAYDEELDTTKRLQMVFTEIDRLMAMNIESLHEAYKEIWPVLEYNYRFFFNELGRIFFSTVINIFDEFSFNKIL